MYKIILEIWILGGDRQYKILKESYLTDSSC